MQAEVKKKKRGDSPYGFHAEVCSGDRTGMKSLTFDRVQGFYSGNGKAGRGITANGIRASRRG